MVERIEKKLSSWKGRYLLIGGKMILLKSILSSMPLFFLSMFTAPKTIVRRIEKLQLDFLWHSKDGDSKIHHLNWDSVCHPKTEGVLGVHPLQLVNHALLGK